MILINTIPKSGTYLLALLLSKLGIEDSGLHFRNDRYWNFKDKPLDKIIADPLQYLQTVNFENSFQLVVDRKAFAVAHLSFDDTAQTLVNMDNVIHVFAVRNLREYLISQMRFIADPRRQTPKPKWVEQPNDRQRMLEFMMTSAEGYLQRVEKQVGWLNTSVDCFVRFECLIGAQGETKQINLLKKLSETLNLSFDIEQPHRTLIYDVVGHKTRTFSGSQSSINQFWSEEVEQEFNHLGGAELNGILGYS